MLCLLYQQQQQPLPYYFYFICFLRSFYKSINKLINQSVMSLSPRKKNNIQFANQEYLNFIRKNHLQLETTQLRNMKIRSNSRKSSYKQQYGQNQQQRKSQQNCSSLSNYHTISQSVNSSQLSGYLKNTQSENSPKLHKHEQGNCQIPSHLLIPQLFSNIKQNKSLVQQSLVISDLKKINKITAEKLIRRRNNILNSKKQIVLINYQNQTKKNTSNINSQIDKEMCQIASKQLIHYSSKQQQQSINSGIYTNLSENKSAQYKFGGSLTLKERQLVQMWRQSKLNKRMRYKKPQSQIKLPNIFTKEIREDYIKNGSQIGIKKYQTLTDRNNNKSPNHHQRYNSYNIHNQNSEIRNSTNHNSLKQYPQKRVDQLGSLQIKTIDTERERQNYNIKAIPSFKVSPSEYMRMKKKRGVPPKLHKLSEQLSKTKQKKQGKQLLQERQKELSKFLLENQILKSDKIINYYEKQVKQAKKLMFSNLHQGGQKVIVFNKCPIETSSQQQNCQNIQKSYDNQDYNPQTQLEEQNNQLRYEQSELNINQKSSNLLERSIQKQRKKRVFEGISKINNNDNLSIYQIKIKSYREFLFMLNIAHKVFDPVVLKDFSVYKNQKRFKFCIGKGNNRLLIKSLMKRRFWWQEEEDPKKANFVWTQLKINQLYMLQPQYTFQTDKFDKVLAQTQQLSIKKQKKQKINLQPNSKGGVFRAPFPPSDEKILTLADKKYYDQYLMQSKTCTKDLSIFSNRLQYFPQNICLPRKKQIQQQKMHNHLQNNFFIGNKKALYYNLKQFYDLQNKNVFQIIPYTLHIKKGVTDPAYKQFVSQFKKIQSQMKKQTTKLKNIWIVKPGELSNRGQGITVIDQIYQLNSILKKKQKHNNGIQKSYILQKYIEKPLLYKNRKFDIRHYMLITRMHGRMRAYFYGEGYIRTSSQEFNLQELDENIHLTNDAIQKHCQTYGKHEEANKVSYNQFQRYLDLTFGEGKVSFTQKIYPKMKAIALDAVKATYLQLDPRQLQHNFQVLGLDFMIDASFNVWLIQANTNPCLQLSSKLLGRIIPQMVENTLRVTLDTIFPPPSHYPNSAKYLCPDNPLQRLQYQLIFDESRDGKQLSQLYKKARQLQMGAVDQDDQIYENEGKQIELQVQVNE